MIWLMSIFVKPRVDWVLDTESGMVMSVWGRRFFRHNSTNSLESVFDCWHNDGGHWVWYSTWLQNLAIGYVATVKADAILTAKMQKTEAGSLTLVRKV